MHDSHTPYPALPFYSSEKRRAVASRKPGAKIFYLHLCACAESTSALEYAHSLEKYYTCSERLAFFSLFFFLSCAHTLRVCCAPTLRQYALHSFVWSHNANGLHSFLLFLCFSVCDNVDADCHNRFLRTISQ